MYKVTYYINGSTVQFKWFKTFHEATDYCINKIPTGEVLEIKKYDDPEKFHYHGD